MPVGMAILKSGYYIASADEFLYKYIDKNSDKPFVDLIHPDDRQEFIDGVKDLENGSKYLLLRFCTYEGNYKYMLFRLKYDGRVISGFRCIEVYVDDIIASMDKYVVNRVNLTKYRRAMSLVDYFFFDYTHRTNKINIYMYANDKSYMMQSGDLDEWKKDMLDNYIMTENDKTKFEAFYIYLKEGLETFKVQFATSFFSRSTRRDSVAVTGSTLFDTDGTRLVTGVINLNSKSVERPYYTTEASKDSATGLMNKRAIMEYSAHKLSEAKNKRLSLLVIDIDDFKSINDNYGHLFGDQVILRIAEILKRVVSTRGTVARFGGDEFVLLLENCDNEAIGYILQTVYSEIGLLFANEHSELNITISVGISNYPQDGNSYEELFLKADKALYIAKANGKNNYVLYDNDKHNEIEVISDRTRMKGLKSIASRVNRSVMYSDIVLMLSEQGEAAIPAVSAKISDLYDIAGISVFAGGNLELKYQYGKYVDKNERYTFLEEKEFVELINEDDMVVIENVKNYSNKAFFENYNRLEINANVTSIYRKNGEVKAVVTFDTFNTSHQWNDADVIALSAVGKLIGQKVSD